MKIAVIKTGGKQYKVAEKSKLKIEKLPGEPGASLEFKEVFLVADDGGVKVGRPTVSGAMVKAKILQQAKDKKVVTIKFKNKTHYRRNIGHRQQFTEVEIEKIS